MSEYPSESDLDKIKNWPLHKWKDYLDLAQFVCDVWKYEGGAVIVEEAKHVSILRLATGGWSGNESIVQALRENRMFSTICWWMSSSGGLHIYILPHKHFDGRAE